MCCAKLRQVATVAVKAGAGWCFDHPSSRSSLRGTDFARFTEIVWASSHLTGIVRLLTQTGLTIGEGAL